MESHATAGEIETLVLNLVGFERTSKFLLIARPDEEPFQRLQSTICPELEFLVIEPRHIESNYNPEVSQRDVAHLAINSSEEALVLNVVTIRGSGRVTVNLRGPIIINRETRQGRQVVPDNAREFSLQHPVQIEP